MVSQRTLKCDSSVNIHDRAVKFWKSFLQNLYIINEYSMQNQFFGEFSVLKASVPLQMAWLCTISIASFVAKHLSSLQSKYFYKKKERSLLSRCTGTLTPGIVVVCQCFDAGALVNGPRHEKAGVGVVCISEMALKFPLAANVGTCLPEILIGCDVSCDSVAKARQLNCWPCPAVQQPQAASQGALCNALPHSLLALPTITTTFTASSPERSLGRQGVLAYLYRVSVIVYCDCGSRLRMREQLP